MVHFKPKQVGKGREICEIKIIVSFRFVPTRRVEENSKTIQKIKKYHYGFISSQNRMEKTEKERK